MAALALGAVSDELESHGEAVELLYRVVPFRVYVLDARSGRTLPNGVQQFLQVAARTFGFEADGAIRLVPYPAFEVEAACGAAREMTKADALYPSDNAGRKAVRVVGAHIALED